MNIQKGFSLLAIVLIIVGVVVVVGVGAFVYQQYSSNPNPNPNPIVCTPSWTCNWGPCTNGSQSQVAVDSNNCGTTTGQIACSTLAQACTTSAQPSITVTSPTANQTITSPVLVKGQSNTFEGYVSIRIKDSNGKVLANDQGHGGFGQMSPYSKSVSYSPPSARTGIVEVFENSAKDGSEINKVTKGVIFGDFNSTQPSGLTADKILNSNGFVNGKKDNNQQGSHESISNLVFGDLDGDGQLEAIAVNLWCGASCGQGVDAFKLVGNDVLMILLPDSGVAGAAQSIDSISISNGLAVVKETDFGGTRTTNYQVKLVNGALTATKINSTQPSITVTSPNGGETWRVGETHRITWTSSGVQNVNLRLNFGASRFYDIASNITALSGSYSWTIPNNELVLASQAWMVVSSSSISDYSNNYFSIVAPTVQPSITVTSPQEGNQWKKGSTYNITWGTTGLNANDKVYIMLTTPCMNPANCLSYNVTPINGDVPATSGSYSWTIPSTIGVYNSYIINVTLRTNSAIAGGQMFSIVAP